MMWPRADALLEAEMSGISFMQKREYPSCGLPIIFCAGDGMALNAFLDKDTPPGEMFRCSCAGRRRTKMHRR